MTEYSAKRMTISLRLRFEKQEYPFEKEQEHLDVYLSPNALMCLVDSLSGIQGVISGD